jgi:hypothetical protein
MKKPFNQCLERLRPNVLRYYDLCLVIRQAKDEMKLLDDQFDELSQEAIQADAVEWLVSGGTNAFCREWEAMNPDWQVSNKGIRKKK